MGITIATELRQRMGLYDAVANWSAVAEAAYERKVAEFKGASAEVSGYDRGRDAGRGWAMDSATPQELDRLKSFSRVDRSRVREWPGGFESATEAACYAAGFICLDAAIAREPGGVAGPAFAWTQALRIFGGVENCGSPGFLRGFVEGAAEIRLRS